MLGNTIIYFTNLTSRAKQIPSNTPRESNRLLFTLHSRSHAYLLYKTGFIVEFRLADAHVKASNLLLPIITSTGVWKLHTFMYFNMAKPPKGPFPHQILLESKELPTSLKNLIIVKEFINKFGEVQLLFL